jgi:UDP-N-acetylmuramyl pentapeptide phosphotransferase/UDP-N-acetylglucosamine-1-phosphate transferase
MSLIDLGITGLVFFLSAWLTKYFSLPVSKLYYLDHPNSRSLHIKPIPRTGGLAIFISLAIGILLSGLRLSTIGLQEDMRTSGRVLGMLLLVAVISFWDDRVGLPSIVRFGIHAIASSGMVLWAGLTLNVITIPHLGTLWLGWLTIPFTILCLMWMTNLYNFMDGMDGFAGGMAVLGFGFLSYIAWNGGQASIALLSLLTAGAAGGFLIFNIPPARIFMGDVGSTLLGFLAGALAVMGIYKGLFDLWVPILIFSPFIVDSTVTLFRRLLRGERVWQAHREHYYQRLVLSGWSHRKTVLTEYCLMIACGLSAVSYSQVNESGRLAILLTWVLLYLAMALKVRAIERQRKRQNGALIEYKSEAVRNTFDKLAQEGMTVSLISENAEEGYKDND